MLIKSLILTMLIEVITIAGRILFGSMGEKYRAMKFRYKIRIHHGYIGILLILIHFICYPAEPLFIAGISLFLSDLLHHFVVLPIWVGKTEFPQ